MKRKKYETWTCKEVKNRDELIAAIKAKEKAIIFDIEIDKSLKETYRKNTKIGNRKAASTLVMLAGAIVGFFIPVAGWFGVAGLLGMIGKDELKKYISYDFKKDERIYIVLLRATKVDTKLDTIMYNGEKIM